MDIYGKNFQDWLEDGENDTSEGMLNMFRKTQKRMKLFTADDSDSEGPLRSQKFIEVRRSSANEERGRRSRSQPGPLNAEESLVGFQPKVASTPLPGKRKRETAFQPNLSPIRDPKEPSSKKTRSDNKENLEKEKPALVTRRPSMPSNQPAIQFLFRKIRSRSRPVVNKNTRAGTPDIDQMAPSRKAALDPPKEMDIIASNSSIELLPPDPIESERAQIDRETPRTSKPAEKSRKLLDFEVHEDEDEGGAVEEMIDGGLIEEIVQRVETDGEQIQPGAGEHVGEGIDSPGQVNALHVPTAIEISADFDAIDEYLIPAPVAAQTAARNVSGADNESSDDVAVDIHAKKTRPASDKNYSRSTSATKKTSPAQNQIHDASRAEESPQNVFELLSPPSIRIERSPGTFRQSEDGLHAPVRESSVADQSWRNIVDPDSEDEDPAPVNTEVQSEPPQRKSHKASEPFKEIQNVKAPKPQKKSKRHERHSDSGNDSEADNIQPEQKKKVQRKHRSTEDSDDEQEPYVMYDPKERGIDCYNLRVRKRIHDILIDKHGQEFMVVTTRGKFSIKEHQRENELRKLMREAKVTESQLIQDLSDHFMSTKDKLKKVKRIIEERKRIPAAFTSKRKTIRAKANFEPDDSYKKVIRAIEKAPTQNEHVEPCVSENGVANLDSLTFKQCSPGVSFAPTQAGCGVFKIEPGSTKSLSTSKKCGLSILTIAGKADLKRGSRTHLLNTLSMASVAVGESYAITNNDEKTFICLMSQIPATS